MLYKFCKVYWSKISDIYWCFVACICSTSSGADEDCNAAVESVPPKHFSKLFLQFLGSLSLQRFGQCHHREVINSVREFVIVWCSIKRWVQVWVSLQKFRNRLTHVDIAGYQRYPSRINYRLFHNDYSQNLILMIFHHIIWIIVSQNSSCTIS